MLFSIRKLTRLQLIAFCLMAALGITTFGFSWFSSAKNLPSSQPQTINSASKAIGQQQSNVTTPVAPHADFTTLAINLTRFGFEPAAINVVTGNYLFSVRNMTGIGSVPLTITRKNGDKIISDTTKEGKRRWDQVVKFTPGEYVLTVADNPNWTCAISVQPPGKQ